ncbi:hypothetical protein [Paraflavitalea speifideaquila]|uniref:hypothetical protein n=1 Tax=Paraflavitalea speifideaquila TaxID=3076558 RepID=UPI0028EF1967|nr:hypothetical protein [Paraflavitalea speifideiaquila]
MGSTEGNYLINIKATIIANNQYEILKVLDLEIIVASYFNQEEYSSISQLIKTGEIAKIKTWESKKMQQSMSIFCFLETRMTESLLLVFMTRKNYGRIRKLLRWSH